MKSEPRRLTSRRGHGVDVPTERAVRRIVSGKSDPRTVGRKHWLVVVAGIRRQTSGLTAASFDEPDVARVSEGDMRATDRRILQKHGRARPGFAQGAAEDEHDYEQ